VVRFKPFSLALVSLRISGHALDPSKITSEPGIEPTQVRIKGQPRPGGKSVWDESMWEYEPTPSGREREWRSLEEGLRAVLSLFASRQQLLRDYQQRFRVCLFCGHFTSSFNGGPTLAPSLLKELGDFGVELFLDTYGSGEPAPGA
jgi:Domain of unknown function (DUF4279)